MPNSRFPTYDPNSEGFNRLYDMGEGNTPSNGFPSVNSNAITDRIQQQALKSPWIPENKNPIDIAGFSTDRSVLEGIGGSFNSPVSNSNEFSLSDYDDIINFDSSKGILSDWGSLLPEGKKPTTSNNSWGGVNSASQVNNYEGPSTRDRATDAYVTSQKAISEALVSNLGQSTAMGWAGFAVQAVQSVANIAMSIEQYKLGKKQFKQAKKEYAYNVDKREQSIHDTLSTRAEQGGLTGQAKEDWMSSRGANANRY